MSLTAPHQKRRLVLLLILAYWGVADIACARQPNAGPQAAHVFSVHDLDADGYLDRLEYQALLEHRRRHHAASGRPARHFRNPIAFNRFDANGDKQISEQELTRLLGQRLRQRKRRHRAVHDRD